MKESFQKLFDKLQILFSMWTHQGFLRWSSWLPLLLLVLYLELKVWLIDLELTWNVLFSCCNFHSWKLRWKVKESFLNNINCREGTSFSYSSLLVAEWIILPKLVVFHFWNQRKKMHLELRWSIEETCIILAAKYIDSEKFLKFFSIRSSIHFTYLFFKLLFWPC